MATEYKRMHSLRGSKSELPQSLAAGEFGLCLDTKELFIGVSAAELNETVNGFIRLTSIYNASLHANYTIDNYVFYIDLNDPLISEADILLAPDINVSNDFFRKFFKVGTRLFISYEYKYQGMSLVIPAFPGMGLGTEHRLSDLIGISPFEDYGIDISSLGYTFLEASVISALINFAFVPSTGIKTGITNVMQNLKVVTEADGYYSSPILKEVVSGTNINLLRINKNDFQSYIFEYSAYNETSNFLETGTITISCLPSVAAIGFSNTNKVVVNGSAANLTFNAVDSSSTVLIRCTSLIPLKIQMRSRKWKVI